MHYRESQKKFMRLAGYGMKNMRLILKIEMLIYQSKANLEKKILFGKITHGFDPEIWKMLGRGIFRIKDSTFHLSL